LGGDCGGPTCPSVSLLTSADRGQTWTAVNPPPARWDVGAAEQSLDQTAADTAFSVRFANGNDGYAFGGGLWSTHDGARTWQKVQAPNGAIVDALEVANGVAHAVIAGNDGFHVMTSPADHDDWRPAPIVIPYGAGPVPSVQLVLNHNAGWILENDRTVVGGARLVNGTWSTWTPPCVDGGGPATLAASNATDVWAVCNEGIWGGPNPPVTRAYHSTDGGGSFTVASGHLPSPTTDAVQVLATPGPTTVVAGSTSSSGLALRASFDGGTTWSVVWTGPSADQWAELGFTTKDQGVAVVSTTAGNGAGAGAMLLTDDGGHSWSAVSFAH
jgi:hypothetical protein